MRTRQNHMENTVVLIGHIFLKSIGIGGNSSLINIVYN